MKPAELYPDSEVGEQSFFACGPFYVIVHVPLRMYLANFERKIGFLDLLICPPVIHSFGGLVTGSKGAVFNRTIHTNKQL